MWTCWGAWLTNTVDTGILQIHIVIIILRALKYGFTLSYITESKGAIWSVINGSGPSCWERVRVETGPLPIWGSVSSLCLNHQFGCDSMKITQAVWIVRAACLMYSSSVCWLTQCSCFYGLRIVFNQNNIFNIEYSLFECVAGCDINYFGIKVVAFVLCI